MGIRSAVVAGVLGVGVVAAPIPSPTPEIPDRAYQAYVAASQHPENTCGVQWADLAAIGKLETDHARYGGRTLTPEGKMTPILWVWDVKAMGGGPMAFLEPSWATFGRGGDVQDIDDATVAAVRLLCHNGYATDPDDAIRRYNGSGPRAQVYRERAVALRGEYLKLPAPAAGATSTPSGSPSRNVADWVTVRTIGRVDQTLELLRSGDGPISDALEGPETSFDQWQAQMLATTPSSVPDTPQGSMVSVATRSDLYRTIEVDSSIAGDVQRLLNDAAAQGVVLSGWGWRSERRTAELRVLNGCPDVHTSPASTCATPTARPGSSMHEQGLAVDFRNCGRTSACYRWLTANAHRYGLYLLGDRNTNGVVDPGESRVEPWHVSTNGR